MSNPNHDAQTGRFASGSSSGAATGDHQKVSPNSERRNVGGLNVSRKVVVTKHNGADSVGTGGNGSSGSPGTVSPGGSFNVRLKPKGPRLDTTASRNPQQMTRGLGRAARERAALNEATDRRHYPNEAKDVQSRFKSRATGIR
jgi:hypothetical protein